MKNYQFQAGIVEQEVRRLLSEYPDIAGDHELKVDMLEGETELLTIIEKLVIAERENQAMATSCNSLIEKYSERKQKFMQRKEYNRRLIQRLLEAADVKSVDVPAGRISVVNSPKSVIITDETAIPDEFMRVKREPNKSALKEALEQGKTIAGATLSNGGNKLQIR
jgi:phage host-nuclease inhibitor protein Gam